MFAFCAKKREKANIDENIDTLNFIDTLIANLRMKT